MRKEKLIHLLVLVFLTLLKLMNLHYLTLESRFVVGGGVLRRVGVHTEIFSLVGILFAVTILCNKTIRSAKFSSRHKRVEIVSNFSPLKELSLQNNQPQRKMLKN